MYVDRRQRVRLAQQAEQSDTDRRLIAGNLALAAEGFNSTNGRALSDDDTRKVALPKLGFLDRRFPWERD